MCTRNLTKRINKKSQRCFASPSSLTAINPTAVFRQQAHCLNLPGIRLHILLLVLSYWLTVCAAAQEMRLLDSLRPVVQSQGPSRHFAGLYYDLTAKIGSQTRRLPESSRNFINRFAGNFLRFFLEAHRSRQDGNPAPENWVRYYRQPAHPMLLAFSGMNAHINGDMWQALRQTGPADSIRKYRSYFLRMRREFRRFFDSVYNEALNTPRLLHWHEFSKGLGRLYGRSLIARWRKRQLHLAVWHETRPDRFRRRWKRVQRTKARLDGLAARWLRP